jgi:hypothetical protein
MKDIKVGEKVVCVHSEGIEWALTNGRRYTVEGIKSRETEYNGLSFFKYFLTIENDNGLKIDYSIGRFKTLKEIREEKLNKLGIY